MESKKADQGSKTASQKNNNQKFPVKKVNTGKSVTNKKKG